MGTVIGGFPLHSMNRRTIRSDPNPLDKATLVSIFPREILEIKPTIQPGTFHIASGTYEKPAILIIGTSSWWKELEDNQPLLEITHGSIAVADSIIKDYCNGLLGCNMGNQMPGLFFVPGEHTVATIIKDKKPLLDRAQENQKRWFEELVKMADGLWARSQGNPLAIWDIMRIAARDLGKDKPWIKDYQVAELVPCKACGSLRNKLYPVCANCKSVDQTHPGAKDLKFAM
jgi:hypothetical protein